MTRPQYIRIKQVYIEFVRMTEALKRYWMSTATSGVSSVGLERNKKCVCFTSREWVLSWESGEMLETPICNCIIGQ